MPYLRNAEFAGSLLDFPSKIQIQTTNRCNYTCPMCPYPESAGGREGVRLDDALYHRLIKEVREAGRRVKLCLMLQNEPLLDKRFLDLLDEAHRAEDAIASISTVSNGSVLDTAMLDRLMTYERFFLTLSINATDRERYREIHGRDFWDRVHGLLSNWNGPRRRLRLSFVLDSRSVDEARRFQEYWRSLGYWTRFVPINARVDEMTQNARVHEFDESYGHCHYPVDTLNVLADGSVILCCNDWKHLDRYGNLRTQGISEVWNGPQLTRLRKAALEGTLREHPMCKACDYPVRSSQRLRLESMVSQEPAALEGGGAQPHVVHETSLRAPGLSSPLPALVWAVDVPEGEVTLLMPREAADQLPEAVLLELRIGHAGAFNFGALEPVWCPGKVRLEGPAAGTEDAVILRVTLDRSREEFQFLRWYSEDWATRAAPATAAPLLAANR
ncbi:radical SAM/SPASM domain-containing protein [Hyalangium rubrum]|uniref:Radical SAM protein n=1 Tax=Hyalangium rubrum TaxID=3103134 RepID=A0ABU5H7H5_9BACT|nr:radical SAM protein [Hyalangium sp. s54d21]MDY7228808.1 radical SAM protein [Hyalangium sp. s54d21]